MHELHEDLGLRPRNAEVVLVATAIHAPDALPPQALEIKPEALSDPILAALWNQYRRTSRSRRAVDWGSTARRAAKDDHRAAITLDDLRVEHRASDWRERVPFAVAILAERDARCEQSRALAAVATTTPGTREHVAAMDALSAAGARVVRMRDAAVIDPPPILRMDWVPRRFVGWLWKPYLPLGKLVALCGLPEASKSMLVTDWAARLSRGDAFPGDERRVDGPRATLVLAAEDDPEDTIGPRLDAAGADCSRIVVMRPEAPHVTLADGAALDAMIVGAERETGCPVGMIVIDPLGCYLPPKCDLNSESDMRRALRSLTLIVAKHGIVGALVAHVRKGAAGDALHRVSGSQAIGAAARSVLGVVREGERRRVGIVKGNLARWPPTWQYDIVGDDGSPSLRWEPRPDPMERDEWMRLFGGGAQTDAGDGSGDGRARLLDIIRRRGGSATPRDLMRASRKYATVDAAEAALNALGLDRLGRWETDDHQGGSGRPMRRFVLSDASGGADGADADTIAQPQRVRGILSTVGASAGVGIGADGLAGAAA